MRTSYSGTNQEIGSFSYGWRLSIVGLVYEDINNKIGIFVMT